MILHRDQEGEGLLARRRALDVVDQILIGAHIRHVAADEVRVVVLEVVQKYVVVEAEPRVGRCSVPAARQIRMHSVGTVAEVPEIVRERRHGVVDIHGVGDRGRGQITCRDTGQHLELGVGRPAAVDGRQRDSGDRIPVFRQAVPERIGICGHILKKVIRVAVRLVHDNNDIRGVRCVDIEFLPVAFKVTVADVALGLLGDQELDRQ